MEKNAKINVKYIRYSVESTMSKIFVQNVVKNTLQLL